jgi:hypothetical protein
MTAFGRGLGSGGVVFEGVAEDVWGWSWVDSGGGVLVVGLNAKGRRMTRQKKVVRKEGEGKKRKQSRRIDISDCGDVQEGM